MDFSTGEMDNLTWPGRPLLQVFQILLTWTGCSRFPRFFSFEQNWVVIQLVELSIRNVPHPGCFLGGRWVQMAGMQLDHPWWQRLED